MSFSWRLSSPSRITRRRSATTQLRCVGACGCQTVRTPEEKIARSNIPKEFTKVSMPDYVVEPPDLILVEVLEALPQHRPGLRAEPIVPARIAVST